MPTGNSLHRVLDVTVDKDRSRIRKDNAPENFALRRRLALCLLKQETSSKRSIKGQRLRASWDGDYLLRVLWGEAENSMRLPWYKGYLVTPASPGSGTAKEQELLAGEVQNRLNETSPRVVLET